MAVVEWPEAADIAPRPALQVRLSPTARDAERRIDYVPNCPCPVCRKEREDNMKGIVLLAKGEQMTI